MPEDIHQILGSIESEVRGINARLDRQTTFLFGQGGLEPRLRVVENEQAVIRTKAGMLSAAISAAIAFVVSFFHWGK